jgi:hypothetical protein
VRMWPATAMTWSEWRREPRGWLSVFQLKEADNAKALRQEAPWHWLKIGRSNTGIGMRRWAEVEARSRPRNILDAIVRLSFEGDSLVYQPLGSPQGSCVKFWPCQKQVILAQNE